MSKPAVSFVDPEILKCPFAAYREIRKDGPVYFDESCGFYMVIGYEELRQVSGDPETFSSVTGQLLVKEASFQGKVRKVFEEHGFVPVNTLVVADPPVHTFHRKLVDKAFNVMAMKQIEDFIDKTVDGVVADFVAAGEGDFYNVAARVPSYVIANQLGLPKEDFVKFRAWTDAVVAEANPDNTEERQLEITRTICDLQQYISSKADEFLANPKSCLLSNLVHSEVNGQRLSRDELVSICVILIAGAHDTTTSAMCSGLYRIATDQQLQARLRENHALIPKFIEESLRYDSPVHGLYRRATRATKVGDTSIPEGAILVLRYGAANRDPSVFNAADELNIDRTNASRHLAFGSGPHMCVGNLLARTELRVAFTKMLEKTRNIRLKDGESSVSWLTQFIVYGPKRLELAFDLA